MAATHTSSLDADKIASKWVSAFGDALVRADVDAATLLFHEQGWFRNMLTFSWDWDSFSGHTAIKSYLSNTIPKVQISNVQLDTRHGYAPLATKGGPGPELVELLFTYETKTARGQGVARLFPPAEGEEIAKAFLVVMMVTDWKGHEEMSYLRGVPDGHTLAWGDIAAERKSAIESNPTAVIVGAGQTGLMIAARLRQMGIPAIVIEQYPRVGDGWRKRYPSLFLHTPKKQSSFLYQPYPSNWPEFTPRDKLAAWLEQYAESNDLIVWTSSKVEPKPSYDKASGKWSIVVSRDGKPVCLQPKHLIWATGIFGDKRIPVVPGIGSFKGPSFHAMDYKGGEPFAGKNVIVVGSGNTGVDICQDLHAKGAGSVTLVQRSPQILVSNKAVGVFFSMLYPEHIPTEACDLKFATMPVPLLREMGKTMVPWLNEFDKDMHDGVKKQGFRVWNGPDDSGALITTFERAGGSSIDVGCAQLIIDGKVKVKHGVELARASANTVTFTDGSELKADAIIFATSYGSKKEQLRPIFGDDIIDRIDDIWGIDPKSGDIRAGYRPTKQPGLWIPVGDFVFARQFSKLLGLYLKAIEIGLTTYDEIIKTH